jgi:hypothetical protein
MFVNVSPSNYNESESKNSMDYATRVKKIKNKVQKNSETTATVALKKVINDQDEIIQKLKDIVSRSNLSEELKAIEALLGNFNIDLVASPSGKELHSDEEEKKEDTQ